MFYRLWAGFLLAALIGHTAVASPEILPLSQVKPGQKGYGLTTMYGTTPEKFSFEVVSIARNFLPMVDIIIVKSDDPKLAVTAKHP